MSNTNQATKTTELVIIHECDAPKETVFNAFAEAAALAEWWGPPGFPITVVKLDFRPGGIFHYKAEMQGMTMWGRFIYKEIRRPDVLEFISSFSDENGGISSAAFAPDFPKEIFNRLEFTERDGKTTITLKGHPINATEAEMQAFAAMTAGMQQGFAGTFAQLDNYLAKKK